MEGSLPIIGLMLEAPAALTKTADPASASNPFAALLAQPVDHPAGMPAGTGLPPSGLPLPPVPAALKPVAAPASTDLPATGTPLTAVLDPIAAPASTDLPATRQSLTAVLDSVAGPASTDFPANGTSLTADPLISELLKAPGNARVTENTNVAAGEGPLSTATLAVVTTETDGDVPALPQAATDSSAAIPSGESDGGAPAPPPFGAVARPLPVEAARQFVAEPDLTATRPSDDPGSLRRQDRPTPYTSQAVLRDPPAPATNPAAATMATRTDLAGPSATAAAAVAVPVQQAGTQTESAGAETLDMPDLPFDSIRVSVRDPAADRPMANREPAFHLPGPRQALGHPQWARALGERLAVVVRGEHQTARMSLNPAHLGPIDIQLRLQDDQAQLWLTAQHPQARDALEAAIPRLREMFAQQGIDLSQQGTSGQQREQSADARPERPTHAARPGPDREDAEAPAVRRPRGGGLLDHYA